MSTEGPSSVREGGNNRWKEMLYSTYDLVDQVSGCSFVIITVCTTVASCDSDSGRRPDEAEIDPIEPCTTDRHYILC